MERAFSRCGWRNGYRVARVKLEKLVDTAIGIFEKTGSEVKCFYIDYCGDGTPDQALLDRIVPKVPKGASLCVKTHRWPERKYKTIQPYAKIMLYDGADTCVRIGADSVDYFDESSGYGLHKVQTSLSVTLPRELAGHAEPLLQNLTRKWPLGKGMSEVHA